MTEGFGMDIGEVTQTGQDVIESIRRDEYMIGLEMAPDVQAAANRLRQQLGNALELLAADLYASETHFLLELIQNADDNTYVQGVVPTVRIDLRAGELVFFNNESGFMETNVRALCGVGKSTKAKDKKSGFIGEKGIGFKSVFQVSDTPEIHSNGFHFFFDMSKRDELLGYVVPNWKLPLFKTEAVGTTIVLPAKHGRPFTTDLLAQLHPKLMLFLRRLRRMEFVTEAGRQVYERRDSGNIVTVFTGERAASDSMARKSAEQYLRFVSPISMANAIDEKREGIASSELVLAFPLDSSGKALAQAGKEVFAFLPIRNFGFRFYVQGDFLLSSSREDILESREWNRHLRDSIAPAFVMAIEEFKASPAVATGYLNYLPDADEITHAFFKPVVDQLLSALADTECVPCATGVWRKPADVMLAPAGFSDLVSPEDALKLFGKDYPSPDLEVSDRTLGRIGYKSLLVTDVIAMFAEHTLWLQQRGIDWMIDFYRFVAGLERKPLLDEGLAEAPIVLDANGVLQSAASRAIFYPLVPGKKFGFEHELTICHESIAKVADGEVRSLLNDVGVKSADPYELITSHILPLHEKDQWKKSKWSSLIGHLCYVKEMVRRYVDGAKAHGTSEDAAWKALLEGLRIGTKKQDGGWTFWLASELYLSSEYAPDFDIEAILREKIPGSRLVSPLYLSGMDGSKSVRPEELASWKAFLFALGVNPSPRTIHNNYNDVTCSEEFELLLNSPDAGARRLTLECLDRHWSRYPSTTQFIPKGRSPSARQQYSLVTRLRATIAPSKKRRDVRLDASFHDAPQLRDALGDSPHYVDAHLENESFLDACGIRYRPDVETCVARLRQLREAGHTGFPEVQRIYRLLERLHSHDPATVKQAFRGDELILTRASVAWKRVSDVVWMQQGAFLGTLYPSLQAHYSEYQSFFRKIGVPSELPVAALIRALPRLDTAELSAEERVAEMMRIYGRANREVVSPSGDGSKPAWLDEFRAGRSFLSTHDKMVANDGRLFLNDKPAIAELFRARSGIGFVAVPPMRLPQVQALLVAAEVPLLSSVVSLQLENPGQGTQNVELSRRIHERYGLIARLVYSNSHAAFSRAVEAGKWTRLAALTVEEVDNLVLRVELLEETAAMTGDVIIDRTTAYVRVGVKGVVDRLAGEICALLAVSPPLADGISRILSESEFAGAEEFLEVKGVTELPDDEREMLLSGGAVSRHSEANQLFREEHRVEDGETARVQAATLSGTTPRVTSNMPRPGGVPAAAPAGAKAVPFGQALGSHNSAPSEDAGAVPPVGATSTVVASGAATSPSPGSRLGASTHRPMRFSPVKPGLALQMTLRRLAAGNERARNQEGTRRLVSYVEPASSTDASDSMDPDVLEARLQVERAAVRFFIDSQSANWSSLEQMPSHNTGFDIKGISLDGRQYYIEVKGQSGAWTAAGIAMTPSEMLCAAQHNDLYWLCVVEYALDENRRSLHIVKNPFGDAGQFRYDSGWKDVAVSERSAALVPAAGLRIKIDDVGSGEIVRVVKSGGIFSRIQVRLDDGSEIVRVFNPAKMQLSKAK